MRGVLTRLVEDWRFAWEWLILSGIGTAPFTPRPVRRGIYRLAGAHLATAPGTLMTFAGKPSNLTIGPAGYMNQKVFLEAIAPVTIGVGCAFGMEAMVLTSHHEVADDGTWSPTSTGRPVTIGDRVWVGARVTILPGTIIESDVIIAAGAVVHGTLRSHGVYAGVPARRIRSLGDSSE